MKKTLTDILHESSVKAKSLRAEREANPDHKYRPDPRIPQEIADQLYTLGNIRSQFIDARQRSKAHVEHCNKQIDAIDELAATFHAELEIATGFKEPVSES